MNQRALLTATALLALVAQGGAAKAALMVEAVVSPLGGGGFHYEITVDNDSSTDFSLVTLAAPVGDPLIAPSLTAPAGFLALYDGGLGLLDLVEGFAGTAFFAAGSVVGGFAFDSTFGIGDGFFASFDALGTLGEMVIGEPVRLVPAALAAPEPAVLALLALGLVPVLGSRRRPLSTTVTMETSR